MTGIRDYQTQIMDTRHTWDRREGALFSFPCLHRATCNHLRHLFGTQERGLEWDIHFKVVMGHVVVEANNTTREEGQETD